MSSAHGINIIVDWSPRKVNVYDIATQQTREHDPAQPLPYSGKTAILAISRKAIFVRAARVPNAAPEEIRMVVQVKLAELFPLPPHELAYDFLLLNDINAEGRLALIMAMPVVELRKAKERMAASGIKVARTLPLALAAPLIAESMGLQDAAVVEGNAEYSSVDLVSGGILRYSRVMPPGVPLDVEVSRTFNASGLAHSTVISAGEADYPQADRKTKLTSLQAMATGHIDRFKVNIELPEVLAKRELNARKRRGTVAIAMLAASFVAAFFVYSDWSAINSQTAVTLDKDKKMLAASQKYQKSAQSDSDKQDAITKVLDGAFHPAQNVSDIATVVANCSPAGVWLTGINIERGKEVTIRGTSTTSDGVTNYANALNAYVDEATGQPRMRNGKFLFANNGAIEKIPVVEFSVSAFPIGNLPIALQQKTGS